MIILLQSVTIQIRRLFWHISYYKVRQSNFITKCDRIYYKVRQVVQSATVITKWDVTGVASLQKMSEMSSFFDELHF